MERYKRLTRLHTGAPRFVALCALTIASLGYAGTTLVEGIDPAVVPGDDFFTYANGAWLKATEIPADRSVYGTGSIVAELNLQRVAKLIEQAAQGSAPNDAQSRAIGDFYSSYMDEAAIEKRGITPLEGTLRHIAAITNRKMLARALGESLRADVDVLNNTEVHTPNLFGVWIAADLNDPTRYVPFLVQGGLVMPDRDYYLDPSPSMAQIRKQYETHIAALLRLAGIPDADAKAPRIAELEHRIAEKHWSRADTEQVAKANNPWKRADFERRAPGLDWQAFFTAAHLNQVPDFIVWQPGALQGLSALVANEDLETWKGWLQLHALEHAADTLPKAFVDEEFSFQGKVLTGAVELRPRWKRAVDATNAALGEAVGRLYAAKYFPPSEKARAEAMVRTLITAFGTRIDRLEWMSPQTRVKAKAKLSTLRVSVGYPDKWRDYSGLKIVRGDAFGNAERSDLFEYHRNLAKLGQPVDRSEWVMTPQTVDAVNLPVLNAMNFPAGILQPPYFDPNRPLAMDYGSAGLIIGHEISHSFDDQGALFDAAGRFVRWWAPEDFSHFAAASARLADQFSQYKPFPDLAVNGKQTLSENIADLAGISVAYDAYRQSLNGTEPPPVSGFTADQLFFLSYAQSWRTKYREPALRKRVVTDGHAPGQYRATTVRNVDAWYAAFGVKPGRSLYLAPADRVRIW
jgi:putative endopeptidase